MIITGVGIRVLSVFLVLALILTGVLDIAGLGIFLRFTLANILITVSISLKVLLIIISVNINICLINILTFIINVY